jgi:hypothetical protein
LIGDMSRRLTARNVISTAGSSVAAAPIASRVPTTRMSTNITPPNTSLTGLVRLEYFCARNTRLR